MLAKVSAVAGDPAVAVTPLLCCGIKKIKHIRLQTTTIRLRNPLSDYRLSEPAFKE